MAGTIQVQAIGTAYTLLGSGPMLIRTASPIGLTGQAGTATPGVATVFTALSANDTPFYWPIAENVFALALAPVVAGQPAPSVNVGVTT